MPIFQRYMLCETCTHSTIMRAIPSLVRIGPSNRLSFPLLPTLAFSIHFHNPLTVANPSFPFVLCWRIHTYTRPRPSKEAYTISHLQSRLFSFEKLKTRSWQRQLVPINPRWFKEIEIFQAIFYIQFRYNWYSIKFSLAFSCKKKQYVQSQSVLSDVTVGPNAYNDNESFSHSFVFSLFFVILLLPLLHSTIYKRIYYLQITTVIYREILEPSQLKTAYAHADICIILTRKKKRDVAMPIVRKTEDYAVRWCYTKSICCKSFFEESIGESLESLRFRETWYTRGTSGIKTRLSNKFRSLNSNESRNVMKYGLVERSPAFLNLFDGPKEICHDPWNATADDDWIGEGSSPPGFRRTESFRRRLTRFAYVY